MANENIEIILTSTLGWMMMMENTLSKTRSDTFIALEELRMTKSRIGREHGFSDDAKREMSEIVSELSVVEDEMSVAYSNLTNIRGSFDEFYNQSLRGGTVDGIEAIIKQSRDVIDNASFTNAVKPMRTNIKLFQSDYMVDKTGRKYASIIGSLDKVDAQMIVISKLCEAFDEMARNVREMEAMILE